MSLPNLITIDLDDRRASSTGSSSELEPVVSGLLEALDRSATRATFFATQSLAKSKAPMLGGVTAAGHELAVLTTTTPARRTPYCADFRAHLRSTRGAIESATGVRTRGHRADGFRFDFASEWAYDVLVDEGFEYDASRFPSRHTEYGYAAVPRSVHAIRRWGGTLLEVPPTTADLFSVRVQLGTAGDVRGLPLAVWRFLIAGRQARGEPVVLHLRAATLQRGGFTVFGSAPGWNAAADRRTLDGMVGILGSFPFTSVGNALPELLRSAPIIES